MTREQVMELGIEEIETRAAEILEELKEADAAGIETLNSEIEAIEERRAQIRAEIEQRKRDIAEVIKGAGDVIEEIEERKENNMEIRDSKEYIEAFADYIKTGNDMECRKLTSTNDTTPNGTASVPVPTLVYDIVKTAWEKEGIMSLVRKSYLKGNLKVGFEISGGEATIHAEGAAAVSEEALVLGTVTLIPQSIKKWISISDEVYDLRGEAFLQYIDDELAYRIAKKAADQIVAKIVACGTVSTTTCPGVPVITANAASVGLVATAMAQLSDEAANPVVIMNKATWGAFKTAQYGASYAVDPFEGLPVVFNNTLNAIGAASTGDTIAIVGDLGHGALANFPAGEGIQFKFDELSRKKEDLVEVLGREFVALGVVAPNAFCKINKA